MVTNAITNAPDKNVDQRPLNDIPPAQIITWAITIALAVAAISFTIYNRRKARIRTHRDEFLEVTADQRRRLDETLLPMLDTYFTQSIPPLREAVYRVRRYAKNRNGLEQAWQRYESTPAREFTPIAASVRIAPIENRTDSDLRETYDQLRDYLDEFDRHVA